MSEASKALEGARRAIDELGAAAEAHHQRLAEIKDDRTLSREYKSELSAQERATFEGVYRTAYLKANGHIEQASRLAAQRLAGPGDSDTETRKSRAAIRVLRMIDSGMPPLVAAEVLAEANDVDALRVLRDEIPSWAATTIGTTDAVRRRHVINDTLLGIDRAMAPMLTGDDAAAVSVRLDVDNEAARLKATSEHALHNTPMSRMQLAYATPPPPPEPPAASATPTFAQALSALQPATT
jgi:hypothetical protein